MFRRKIEPSYSKPKKVPYSSMSLQFGLLARAAGIPESRMEEWWIEIRDYPYTGGYAAMLMQAKLAWEKIK